MTAGMMVEAMVCKEVVGIGSSGEQSDGQHTSFSVRGVNKGKEGGM